MSKHIAVVSEGPTDVIIIKAVVASILQHNDFVITHLYPEYSEALKRYQGDYGAGWKGVLRWCDAKRGEFGSVENSPVFISHDILIIHLDADVAGENEISLAKPCPPAIDTTDQLRQLLLMRCGIADLPHNIILCIPSKSTETWILAALYPKEKIRGNIECLANPADRLKAKPLRERLISGDHKLVEKYEERSKEVREKWHQVCLRCNEAHLFSDNISVALEI